MDWVFPVFTIGALLYGVSIFREYMAARAKGSLKLDQIENEGKEIQVRIQEYEDRAAAVGNEIAETRKGGKELQSLVEERAAVVALIKQQMARKGKHRVE